MAMDHDVVLPADRFPAVLKALCHLDQFPGTEYAITSIAASVIRLISMGKTELMRGEPALIGFYFSRPLTARRLVEHVTRRFVIVDANLLTEFPAKQSSDRLA